MAFLLRISSRSELVSAYLFHLDYRGQEFIDFVRYEAPRGQRLDVRKLQLSRKAIAPTTGFPSPSYVLPTIGLTLPPAYTRTHEPGWGGILQDEVRLRACTH